MSNKKQNSIKISYLQITMKALLYIKTCVSQKNPLSIGKKHICSKLDLHQFFYKNQP